MVRHSRSRASLRGTPLGRWSLSRLRSAKDWLPVRPRRRKRPPSASVYPTLRQTWPRVGPEAAMCVRKISAQCVLQFTPSLAAGCVLHRPVSRVIHCSELSFFLRIGISPFPVRSRFDRETLRKKAETGGIIEFTETSPAPARLSGRTRLLRAALGKTPGQADLRGGTSLLGSPLRA